MKKFILILIFSLFCLSLFAQNYKTVTELKTENELAERIENLLFPIVGKTIVIVDLTLKYPSEGLILYGTELNRVESLPGLPVAKSKGVLPRKIGGEPTLPTRVTTKKITVYLDKNVEAEKVKFISQSITDWFSLDATKGDVLEIEKVLDISKEQGKQTKIFEDPTVIVLAAILLVMLIFLLVFNARNRSRKPVEAVNSINIEGFDKAIRALNNLPAKMGNIGSGLSNLEFSKEKPLPIKIVATAKEEIKDESMDFHFLEELPIDDFIQLIKDEPSDNIVVVISRISLEYANQFFMEYNGNSIKVIKDMLSVSQRSKKEIQQVREDLFTKYTDFIENKQLTFKGKDTLVNIINNLPLKKASDLFEQVKEINKDVANEIRENIFLSEDILKLDDETIERIIKETDRNLLVSFLVSESSEMQKKFFKNMSERSTLIIKEDMDVLGSLPPQEEESTKNEMLSSIRKILNFK